MSWAWFWFTTTLCAIVAGLEINRAYNRLKELSEACIFLAKAEIAHKDYTIAVLQKISSLDAYKVYYHGYMEAYNEHKGNKRVQEICAEVKIEVEAEMNRLLDQDREGRISSFLRKD